MRRIEESGKDNEIKHPHIHTFSHTHGLHPFRPRHRPFRALPQGHFTCHRCRRCTTPPPSPPPSCRRRTCPFKNVIELFVVPCRMVSQSPDWGSSNSTCIPNCVAKFLIFDHWPPWRLRCSVRLSLGTSDVNIMNLYKSGASDVTRLSEGEHFFHCDSVRPGR